MAGISLQQVHGFGCQPYSSPFESDPKKKGQHSAAKQPPALQNKDILRSTSNATPAAPTAIAIGKNMKFPRRDNGCERRKISLKACRNDMMQYISDKGSQ